MGWSCSAPKGSEVSCCGGGVVAQPCVLALRKLCGLSGIAGGLLVASQFLRMVVLAAKGDAVLGVAFWPRFEIIK
jgi:hypothetical protein